MQEQTKTPLEHVLKPDFHGICVNHTSNLETKLYLGPSGLMLTHLSRLWVYSCVISGCIGAMLGLRWGCWAVMTRCWPILGFTQAHLGPMLGQFSVIWGCLGLYWGYVVFVDCHGPMLAHQGAILGLCWALLGPAFALHWAILGLCKPTLRRLEIV